MRIRLSVHPVCKLFTVLLLASISGTLSAEPKPPPLFCVDDADCVTVEPDNSGSPGGSYTVASIGNIPFAYNTPVPPNISSEATVTPATIEANKVNGRRIILTAGNYGNQTFRTQDQEIVFQSGVEIGFLTVEPSAARMVFRGEPARAGVTGYIKVGNSSGAATDIVFDGINQVHIQEGGQYPRQDNVFNAQRLLVINSRLQAYGFVALSYSGSNNRLVDAIFANNNMADQGSELSGTGYGQAALRMQGAARVIFVDNRLYGTTTDAFHNFRIHAQPSLPAENFYLARNQFEGTGHSFQRSGDGQSTMEILDVWFEDNVQYTTRLSPINVGNDTSSYPTRFRMRNNTLYSAVGGWPSIPGSVSSSSSYSWDFSGNTVEPYRTPPTWQFR